MVFVFASKPKLAAIFNASSLAKNFPEALPIKIRDTIPVRTQ
jgi:hypothetical protein